VATILVTFLRINLPNFVQFKQYYGKIMSMIKGLGLSPLNPPPAGNFAYAAGNSFCETRTARLACVLAARVVSSAEQL